MEVLEVHPIIQELEEKEATQQSVVVAVVVAQALQVEPAVPVQDSVQPDYLVCLEDGKRMTMLKRYIKRVYGLSPEQYRKRWGLPGDYPMTAPNHIENLRATAQLGLAERRARRANRASPALMRAG
jgi:predicted transcriptional regulator